MISELADFQWKNRLVIVFSEKATSLVERQIRLIPKKGATDRQLKFIAGKEAWRQGFNLPKRGTHVLLIGKDGTMKIRRKTLFSAKELFAIIDAMPMRQTEIRVKS